MLGEFLRERHAWRRKPGEWDCVTFPAAWAVALGRPDPLGDLRGAYSTELEGEELLFALGGLAALAGERLAAIGATPVPAEQVAEGDVGVIELLGHEAGAIYTGRRWAFVADRGLGFATIDRDAVVAAWRL